MKKIKGFEILLMFFLISFFILGTNHVFNAEIYSASQSPAETPESTTESSPENTDFLIKNTYDELSATYDVLETDKVPSKVWLNSQEKPMEKFNNAVLSALNQSSIDSITVKMLVEEIKTLNLSGLELDDLPDALFYMSRLESIDLSNNNLVVLDFGGAFLFSLNSLNLSDNKSLQSVNTFTLSALKEINLSSCNLHSQSTFSVNHEIEKINLSNNNIQALKMTILPKLKELDLSKNVLRYLELTDLPALEKISANENKLSAVNFLNIPSVTSLNLSSNFLTSVPDLSSAASLSSGEINLSNNQIIAIPAYLNAMGITPLTGDFSDNLLDSSLYEDQKQLVLKEGVKITVSKNFDHSQVLERLKPFLALKGSKNKDILQPLSPNLGFTTLLEDNEDTAGIESVGITKDFTASLSVNISSQNQLEGIASSNSQAVVSVSFTSLGDVGVVVEGEPYSLMSTTNLSKSATSKTDVETASSTTTSKSSSTTTSSTQKLPQTGSDDFFKVLVLMFVIAILIASIAILLSLRRRQK